MRKKSTIKCSVEGCANMQKARGWCDMHWARWRNHGDINHQTRRMPGSGFFNDGYFSKTINGKKIQDHIAVAEKALGKRLPKGAVVHHVNEKRDDNRPENLVICPGNKYHLLLHVRMRAREACGNPDLRKCNDCKTYDSIGNMVQKAGESYRHKSCRSKSK